MERGGSIYLSGNDCDNRTNNNSMMNCEEKMIVDGASVSAMPNPDEKQER